VPVELQLLELGNRRRFEGWRGDVRRGHAGGRGHWNAGLAGQEQEHCETHASGECPRESGPPTHQDELTRVCRT
jgi:hypothetical protein